MRLGRCTTQPSRPQLSRRRWRATGSRASAFTRSGPWRRLSAKRRACRAADAPVGVRQTPLPLPCRRRRKKRRERPSQTTLTGGRPPQLPAARPGRHHQTAGGFVKRARWGRCYAVSIVASEQRRHAQPQLFWYFLVSETLGRTWSISITILIVWFTVVQLFPVDKWIRRHI